MHGQLGARLESGRPRPHPHERYLEAAVTLAGSQSTRHFAVSHVTIGAVAAAAGVSRGALYRLWPSQQDFWNELIEFLMECPSGANASGPAHTQRGAGPRLGSIYDAAQQVLMVDGRTLLRTATAEADDRSGGSDRAQRRAARLAQLATSLSRGAQVAGRRCVPGVLPTDIAAAVSALGIGTAIVGRMSPPEDLRFDSPWLDLPQDGPRSMLGVATEAIRDRLTEPGDPSPPAPDERSPPADPPAPVSGRRREYLETAARLASTRNGTAPHRVLGHVTIDSVARAAGVSRRTVAAVWPDQDTFRLDLFAHLLRHDRTQVIAAVRAPAHHDPLQHPADAFHDVGARMHRQLIDELGRPTFRSFATQLDEPSVATRAMGEHRRLADATTVQLQRLLASTNRRLRAGVAGRQVAAVLFALNDGFSTLLRTSPGAIRDDITAGDGTPPRSVIGLTVEAVLDAFTEPLDGSAEVHSLVALIS